MVLTLRYLLNKQEMTETEGRKAFPQEFVTDESTGFSQSPRVNARMRVFFGPDSRILTGYAINLSTGGLFLETDIPLSIDNPLLLEFELPDKGGNIRCRGRVAWVNHPDHILKSNFPPGMGIQFLNLSLDELEALREFVKKNLLSAVW